jgi:hypothetical protein
MQPIYMTLINLHIDQRLRATVLSIAGQADAIGQFVGGPAIGAIGTFYSLRAAMVAAGAVLSPALLLYWRMLCGRKESPASLQVSNAPSQSDDTN